MNLFIWYRSAHRLGATGTTTEDNNWGTSLFSILPLSAPQFRCSADKNHQCSCNSPKIPWVVRKCIQLSRLFQPHCSFTSGFWKDYGTSPCQVAVLAPNSNIDKHNEENELLWTLIGNIQLVISNSRSRSMNDKSTQRPEYTRKKQQMLTSPVYLVLDPRPMHKSARLFIKNLILRNKAT